MLVRVGRLGEGITCGGVGRRRADSRVGCGGAEWGGWERGSYEAGFRMGRVWSGRDEGVRDSEGDHTGPRVKGRGGDSGEGVVCSRRGEVGRGWVGHSGYRAPRR